MSSEPTEMAGVAAEAETRSIYAWALDDGDDLPTQRLTSRRITTLALAASLTVIAVAGAVALGVLRQPEPAPALASAPVAPAAVLDGTYRLDYNFDEQTVMGSPNPPPDGQPKFETHWAAFRSTCTPAGCIATSMALDDTNHQIAFTPLTTNQWRLTNGRWEAPPGRMRETRTGCKIEEDKIVDGDETVSYTKSLEPQPDGSLRGLLVMTTVSGECHQEGAVYHHPFVATRVGDVPSGVTVADPSTVRVQPTAPAVPVPGPVLDGTYRLDGDSMTSRWFAFRSICTAADCVATEAHLDVANHQEPTGDGAVYHFTDGHWVNDRPARIPCGQDREHTVLMTTDLVPQPDGTLRGVITITFKSNECGQRGSVMTTSVVGTRTGPVPPNVVLADPALFV